MKRLILSLSLFLAACLEIPTLAPASSATAAATATRALAATRTAYPAPQVCTVRTGIESGALNIRSGAGTSYGVLQVLQEGDELTVTGREKGSWWQVTTEDHLLGWVNSRYCKEGGDPL